jgi:hypothetical protein
MKRETDYSNSVSIIQSSGFGKSRMVDELAQLVFTLPINLRDPKEDAGASSSQVDMISVDIYILTIQLWPIHPPI